MPSNIVSKSIHKVIVNTVSSKDLTKRWMLKKLYLARYWTWYKNYMLKKMTSRSTSILKCDMLKFCMVSISPPVTLSQMLTPFRKSTRKLCAFSLSSSWWRIISDAELDIPPKWNRNELHVLKYQILDEGLVDERVNKWIGEWKNGWVDNKVGGWEDE